MKTRLLLPCGEMPVEGGQPAVRTDGAEKADAAQQPGLTPMAAKPHSQQQERPEPGDLALRVCGRDKLINVCDELLGLGGDAIDIK